MRDRFLKRRLTKNLRKIDVVVTVSEYWRNTLLDLGARDVRIIHNATSGPPMFDSAEIRAFETRFDLLPHRPLVYLGVSHPKKGAVEAYAALANQGYDFVVTGGRKLPGLPVRHLQLSKHDYFLLLKRCDVAVFMSTFPEGWCRAAAEAMFCGTPVVGSGSGGMAELLTEGSQIVCKSFADLPGAVSYAIENRAALSERGRRFVSQFTTARFEAEWQTLVTSLVGNS
jgi:glycosyltransferase involved in cell wall biosynthesis